jgi:hypothetical protein
VPEASTCACVNGQGTFSAKQPTIVGTPYRDGVCTNVPMVRPTLRRCDRILTLAPVLTCSRASRPSDGMRPGVKQPGGLTTVFWERVTAIRSGTLKT